MAKQAISVTLEVDNLAWLRGRAGAAGLRSVSELIDRLVTAARKTGVAGPARSVVGTVTLDPADPMLEKAGAVLQALFDASLGRPLVVSERRVAHGSGRPGRRRRG